MWRLGVAVEQPILSKEFVELTPGPTLAIELKYASEDNFVGQNMYGSFKKAYLHEVAYKKFEAAIRNLKAFEPQFKFIIYDALRPRSVQYVLWNNVKGTEQEQYVANPEGGSVHNYGMALDLSVLDETGTPLDMGTAFDSFTPLAQPKLEEQFLKDGTLTKTQLQNRFILRGAMVRAGFIQLPHEWWHFDALPKAEVKAHYKIVE